LFASALTSGRFGNRMTAGSTKETGMSKGQRGNKEAKKPKKVQSAIKPQLPTEPTPPVPSGAADRFKKK
jgi:hypothetical protein